MRFDEKDFYAERYNRAHFAAGGGVRPVAFRGLYLNGTDGFMSIEYHSETKGGLQLTSEFTMMMWFRADANNNQKGTLLAKHRTAGGAVDEVITWKVNLTAPTTGTLEARLNDLEGYSCDIPLTFARWHIALYYLKVDGNNSEMGCSAKIRESALQSGTPVTILNYNFFDELDNFAFVGKQIDTSDISSNLDFYSGFIREL